jgi:hypothetical protein
MTLARRIAKVEASLTPEQAVLRWLAEAHAFPTLADYVRSLIGGPETAWPLVAIPRQLEASIRTVHRRDTVAVLVGAMQTARWEAVARVEFVLQATVAEGAGGSPRRCPCPRDRPRKARGLGDLCPVGRAGEGARLPVRTTSDGIVPKREPPSHDACGQGGRGVVSASWSTGHRGTE